MPKRTGPALDTLLGLDGFTLAPAALDLATLLEDELAKKHARLDSARKAEVIALLYEEAVAESEEEPRRGKVLRLIRLLA